MVPPFVDQAWLAAHPEAVVADVRWGLAGGPKREDYLAGHLPGAVFVDVDHDLSAHGVQGAGRHPLPEPEAFAEALGRLGIGDGATVVAYDDDSGAIAARLVWLLRSIGTEAAILDGGLAAWNGQLEAGEVRPEPASFTPREWPSDRLATIDEVGEHASSVVIDARPAPRFAGTPDGVDPNPGHIPGSRSLPSRGHTGDGGRLLADDELRARFAAVGVSEPGTELIASCGSGVTACLNLLVAEHLGLAERARLFPGSWSQYSQSGRPIETGADPAGLS